MNREKYISRVTITGGIINFLLVILKFLAGILGHSSAMIADAAHSLSDFASDIILLLCVRVSSKPEDEDHAYGHGKFETLASVAIGLLLLITGLGLFWDGLLAIINFTKGESLEKPGMLALAVAIVSILVKEGLYHYTIKAAKKANSTALKTNGWHHRSDALSSLATLAGIGGAMLLGGSWVVLDPLAACVISIFIIGLACSLMKPGLEELMEKSLPASEKNDIERIIRENPEVISYHNLKTRRMGTRHAVEAHIRLDGEITLYKAHGIATIIERQIRARLGADTHVGIHMEPARYKTKADQA